MKLSPIVTLALILAAGLAGATQAQTSASSSTTTAGQPTYGQPQGNAAPVQPGANQTQAQVSGNIPNNSNEQVRTAQQQLHAAGLYNGPVDGVMDPDTRAAIARFQQQNGLQPTQSLDQQTLAVLSGQPAGFQTGTPTAAPMAPSGSSSSAPMPASAGGSTTGQASQR